VRVLGLTLRLKAEADLSSQVRKILFVEKRRERLHEGYAVGPRTGGPMGQGWKLKFITFFVLPEGGDVFQVQMFPGKEKYLLGQLPPFGASYSLPFSIIDYTKLVGHIEEEAAIYSTHIGETSMGKRWEKKFKKLRACCVNKHV
jgi:hypothetical protein